MDRRKIASLTAALLLIGAMTGCGSGSNDTNDIISSQKEQSISSQEEQNSQSTDENSSEASSEDEVSQSEGENNESGTTLRQAFFEKSKTAPEFTLIFREKNSEHTDDFDDGADIYFSDNGNKLHVTSYDSGKARYTMTYDGTDYYYYLPDAEVYGKGDRIIEDSSENVFDTSNMRGLMSDIFNMILEDELMGAEGLPVETGSMEYDGKTCRYESYELLDSEDNERYRWLFDENGDFCGIVLESEGKTAPLMENYSVSLSIPDDSSLFSVPQGYTECTYAFDRLYKYYEEPISWSEAEAACRKLGGHLASVPDQEIQDFLLAMTKDERTENIWLGGYYDRQDSIWKWTNGWDKGDGFDYTNWDMHISSDGKEIRQPDNYSGSEFCLRYANKNIQYEEWYCNAGKWNDTENGGDSDAPLSSFGYICEWSPYD